MLVVVLFVGLLLPHSTASKESGDSLPVQSEGAEGVELSQDETETSGDPETQTMYET